MNNNLDWEQLKQSLENYGIKRNTTIWVEMPTSPPMRIMDGNTNGIHPMPRDFEEEHRIEKEKAILNFKADLENKIPSKQDTNEIKRGKI